jgi:primase-polymerase (primpol)-like protein
MEGDGRLYYERRVNQYNNDSSVVKKRIISVSNQIKSFSSIFRQDPHLVTTYFGQITKEIGNKKSKLFENDHQFASYYLAGLIFISWIRYSQVMKLIKNLKKLNFT